MNGMARELFLLMAVLAPFFLNDFLFITSKTDLEWLTVDFGTRLLVLAFVAGVPSLRHCVRSSFGKLALPDEIPSMTWLRIGAFIFGALLIHIFFELAVHYPLRDFMPEMRLAQFPQIQDPATYWLDLTFGLALVAVSEEVVFRAILKQAIERFTANRFLIVLLSSVVFGLIHWSHGVSSMLGGFISGIVFMLMFLGTRSLLPPIVAHYCVNLIVFSR